MLSNLFLIAIIILFVGMYSNIFGTVNSLIGVVVITSILMFKDFSLGYETKSSVVITLLFFTLIGCVVSITNIVTPLLGFGINLVFLFLMLYITSENILIKSYLPFILLFIFLDGNPIAVEVIPTRLVACFIGGLLVAITQFIYNGKHDVSQTLKCFYFKDLSFHNDRFVFCLKMSIAVSISILLGNLLELEKMMWISVAIMSVVQPSNTDSKQRMKMRLTSTVLGSLLFILMFEILPLGQYVSILTLMIGYLYTFIEAYDKKMIFVALNAYISTMLIYDTGEAIFLRISYLVIGILIAFIVNSIIETIRSNCKNCYV